jgi:hypothetical protein
MLLWALAWACAMIASAFVFKGNPVKEWIQSALFVSSMTFWLWQVQRTASSRC